eukprot:g24780.t1
MPTCPAREHIRDARFDCVINVISCLTVFTIQVPKMPQACPVVCVETGERHESIRKAALATGINERTIRDALKFNWSAGLVEYRMSSLANPESSEATAPKGLSPNYIMTSNCIFLEILG